MRSLKLSAILVSSMLGFTGFAQEEENVGNVEINVFESYEAKVREATKISSQPNYNDTTTKKIDVDYDFSPRIVETQVELDPIPAAQITTVRKERLPENLVKIGFGNYTTPQVSLILASSRSQSTTWSMAVDHFSTLTGALRDRVVYNDNFDMRNQLRAGVTNVNQRWRLSADLDVDLRDVSYYGVPKLSGVNENLIDSNPLRQRYYKYGINSRYERATSRGNEVFRGVGLSYHFMHDKYGASEHFAKGMTNWTIPAGDVDLYLDGGVEYMGYTSDSSATDLLKIHVKPYVNKVVNDIHFTIGLNINYVGGGVDTLNSTGTDGINKLYVYPDVRAELPLVRDVLNIFGGWIGDVNLNGLSGITEVNPYVAPGVEIRPTGVNKFYAGFSGRISRRFGYNIQGDFFRYSNRAMFSRDSASLYSGFDPYLDVQYIDLDVLAPRVELTYHHPTGIEFSADATYFLYTTPENTSALHMPDFKGGVHASYLWKEKIILKTDFIVTGPRDGFFSTLEENPSAMPTFYDWRLYTEYRYNDYLSAYLSVNNILNQDYDLWYGYPAQGIRFILGGAFRF